MEQEILADYLYFIRERHAIYERRVVGQPWPWTDDKILQTYKFTNIFRELDTGTIHCANAIRTPYTNDPELFFNIATYRRYNLLSTQKAIGYLRNYPKHAKNIIALLMDWRDKGLPIFTGAHMLCGNIRADDGSLPPTKVEQVFGVSFMKLWEKRRELEPQPGDTLESAFKRLQKANIPGYGPFINYEVITDLRHTRYLNQASDIMTWANPGPGCKRGIHWLLWGTEEKQYSMAVIDYLEQMRYLLYLINVDMVGYYQSFMPIVMEMRDIEHSLCEFDKYMRVKTGKGKPRSKFVPPHLREG